MHIRLADFIQDTPAGREAQAVVERCVHCGFCNATCPTYTLFGDELDGPRGRIYLIKQVLEGQPAGDKTRLHLDRCLTCRACETTCPSGVHYSRLLDVGRAVLASRAPRSPLDAARHALLRHVLSRPAVFAGLLKLARRIRPLMPACLAKKVPVLSDPGPWPEPRHPRRMVVLEGCVQPALSPQINAATARVLDRLGISLIKLEAGCCGAVCFHLDDPAGGQQAARRVIDALWPHVEQGVEALVMTASGCGVFVRDYGHLLAHDPSYRTRAEKIAAMTRDVSEIVAAESAAIPAPRARGRVAFHAPCTLQHGQRIRGVVEAILTRAGFSLTTVPDAHLCCGSAGAYSLLQPKIAHTLRDQKLAALTHETPEHIVTANIGCLAHLQSGTDQPVRHWINLLDEAMAG